MNSDPSHSKVLPLRSTWCCKHASRTHVGLDSNRRQLQVFPSVPPLHFYPSLSSWEICNDQLKGVHLAMAGSLQKRRSVKASSGSWEEPGRSFQDAVAWIAQQKRLIETTYWGEDPAGIEKNLISHQRFHNSLQNSPQVDRARSDLVKKGDKGNLHALDQEWDSLKQMSFARMRRLEDLQQIIQELSKEIMWVNDKEEEELIFDWSEKNLDQYIPRKQESYSKLMSALEEKEKHLNKLKVRVDALLKNKHPASDKIEAYRDTLQTQWSWLLQITKCIDVHLKENAAYNQFFKEANETFRTLQGQQESIRKKFTCDKNTPLENLLELLKGLERERETLRDQKRQVQHLVNKSKSIIRLRSRNPEEKSSRPVIVKALCDFKQDQKVICKGDEAILKDNSQRSKWAVTGPGGLDMVIPSVCLILPPPNPLSINLAIKNEQCYESIMSFWNQLYINVKSLIAWHYCLLDIERINSLTISMLARMNPEEYSQFINSLETHYEEFKRSCQGSQMFVENDKRGIESQYNAAQAYYGTLLTKVKKEVVKVSKAEPLKKKVASSSHTLTELQALRLKLAAAEGLLSQHVHICLGDDGVKDCGLKITHLEVSEYAKLRENITKALESMNDSDKAQFLRSELEVITQRLDSLESNLSNYLLRLRALRDLLQSMARAEDIVKVHEARLTEKETTSLLPGEVNDYLRALKDELDGKRDVVASMEAELAKALHWNGQVGGPLYRCDMMLSNCAEQVGQLSDRWRRIQAQIDTRVQDLQRYLPQLEHYKQSSSSFHDWIGDTGKKQAILQATHIQNVQSLKDHISSQKDYETDLASYTSGLETLLNIPIKRTMLRSPSMDLIQEAAQLQTRYMELLTSSDNYLKFIGELLKNMEDLKIRSTRIDVLEEELRMLREALQDRKSKNKALEDAVARYQLELSQSQEKLLSVEEMKRTTALQCDAAKDSLDDTHNQLADLADQVTRLNYLLEEEKRKRKLAEERYTKQQEEYESVLRKRQTELESVSWSKVEVEKTMGNQEHEMKQLRRKLEEETSKAAELRKEISKVRSQCDAKIDNLKLDYDSQIHVSHTTIQRLSAQREDDARQLQLRYDRIQAERRVMEEELGRLKMATAHAEERLRRAEEEAHRQRLVIAEEGRARREVQNEIEVLIKQQEERSNKHQEALAEVEQDLEQKMEQLAYVTHSLEEEVRRRKTTEEGKHVLEQTLAELQAKLASSAMAAAQLTECEAERQNVRLTLEREIRDRSRIEENLNRLQGRVKDIQSVRDGLELQLAHLREANQEEVSKRRQIETELEKTTTTMREYYCAMTALRQKREQVEASERKGEERCLMMQEELERSMEKNKTSVEQISQLSTELKALQQQLLQEQAKIQEVTQRNEGLCRTLEAKTEALNMNSSEVQSLQEKTETLAKERLRLEEELRTTRHDNAELLRFKEEHDDEVSSQITALELQLQASERRNVDYRNLVSELSLERANLKLETEKIQIQAAEVLASPIACSETERERDALLLKLQLSGTDKDNLQKLEEEHRHVKLSLESELQKNQRVQDENDRLKRDLSYWKEQCQSKQGLVDQYDADKERLERERRSLEREIEKLRKELSDSEKTYRGKLAVLQKEVTELTILRQNAQDEVRKITERKDPSKLVFDGVRKTVTAQQLFDCGVLDKATFNQLITGEKTVPEVSVEKQVFLKGSGVIAGVSVGSFQKMSLTQAKKQSILSPESADLLLEAQAATGHIIDPQTNQKLTVIEACARGVVCQEDESKLFAAEAAAIGYRDPNTLSLLSAGQAMKKGLVDKDTALRMLQAQECAGGILDPALGVFLPRDIAMDRNLIDADLYKALSESPQCYLDPDTQLPVSYLSLKKRCRADTITGLLLLPEPKKPTTVQGLRSQVSVIDLVNANLLEPTDINELKEGRLTGQDIEYRLRSYLGKSTCIAGLFDETTDRVMTFYEGMKGGLLQPETTLKLLEAQAASGFIVDPVNNRHLTVNDAYNRGLFGPECLDKLLSAEKAVTGYKLPGTEKVLSLFQAIKRGLVVEGHGIRLLEAQIASGGIIDPDRSHRIDIDVAYSRGYLDEAMTKILTDPEVARKDFFDPNTEENLTYMELKKRCMTDGMTGLVLLPIADKEKEEATMKNTLRKRRVIIVDPQTNKEMNVREAYEKGYIDYSTYLELSQQECEWEEITITEPDGSTRFVIIDKKTGTEYDISELLEKRVIDQSVFDQYRSSTITLTQFADIITEKSQRGLPPTSSTLPSSSSSVIVSVTLASPVESVGGKDPVGAIFDTETLEKISITEALNRGLVDTITAQRLLEAQACTGGIVNPENGRRLSVQEASRQGIINDDMAAKLKPAQKVFIGFEGVKTGKKMSAAEAMKEMWLPYEAGQRFMEFQFVTGGLYDPELGCRRTTEDALKMGWIDGSAAMKLQDIRNHTKNLTCPKSKLKISYKEALDNCLVEESTGLRMLPASSVSSRGISSPYNFASAPGSSTGSRSGSRRSSRRSSLDLGSPTSLSTTSHTVLTTLSTTSQMNKK
uniref:Desmoplakin n=1 Tax=Hippocampus comes TaxID=109280 RepID=A0A3Q2YS46_HIPCM